MREGEWSNEWEVGIGESMRVREKKKTRDNRSKWMNVREQERKGE